MLDVLWCLCVASAVVAVEGLLVLRSREVWMVRVPGCISSLRRRMGKAGLGSI